MQTLQILEYRELGENGQFLHANESVSEGSARTRNETNR